MQPDLRVIAVTSDAGDIVEASWLPQAEAVHRQLRPLLPADYAKRMAEVVAGGGRLAFVVAGEEVLCVTVWRILENTFEGRRLYVDDLVSDETRRSQGAGKLMLTWLEDKAGELGCDVLALDSGVQRGRAHRFYFREGMQIFAFSFRKTLK